MRSLFLGWICVGVLGPLGIVLPVMPGIVFFLAGIVLLSRHHTWARKAMTYFDRRFPRAMQRMRETVPSWAQPYSEC